MDCAVREYCFGFYLHTLEIIDQSHLLLESFTHFRILLLHSGRILAHSTPFLCLPNQHCQVVVNELLSFRVGEEEWCELRLLIISEEGEERVAGRYEFPLTNYKRAYEELRRNCVELSVQIAPHYSLVYDVFLQGSDAALQRIIREHQAAMRSRMYTDAISQADSFLPHEISNREQACRDIRIDEASPLLFCQRFWSPKRGKFGGLRRLSIMSPTNVKENEESVSFLTESNRISLLKLSKTASTFSDIQAKVRNGTCATSHIQQLDIESQPETENHQEQLIQLYQVIKSDSKIMLPDDLEKEQQRRDEQNSVDEPKQKKMKRSIRNDHSLVKYAILAVMVLTIAGFFIYLFDRPTLHLPKNKRSKKPSRKEKY